MTDADDWVAVAVVARPHGLRGGVVVKPLTRSVDEFPDLPLEKVTVRRDGRITGQLTVESVALHKGLPLLFFEEVADRDEADRLRGAELVIPESQRAPLPEGKFYFDQLEGLLVEDKATAQSLGPIRRVQEGAACDYILVAHPTESHREVMIPWIPEIILGVDLAARRVEVQLPAGLLDL